MSSRNKKLAKKYLVRRAAVALAALALLALAGCAIGRLMGSEESSSASSGPSEPSAPASPEPVSSAAPASSGGPENGLIQSGGGEVAPPESSSQPESQPEPEPEPEPEPKPQPEPEPEPEPAAAEPVMKPADLTVDWKLVLINPTHYIEEELDIQLASIDGYQMDSRVVGKVREMIDAAKEDGVYLTLTSGYRTMERSRTLYNNKIAEYRAMGYGEAAARVEAAKWVAPPGTSEHHSGLAMDIISIDYYTKYNDLVEEFEKDTEAIWLRNNCHRFGFILRYPSNKTAVTGINYEPWHYRYVGEKAAKEIMEKGICLEEYLGVLD